MTTLASLVSADGSQIQTPGSGTSSNLIGTNEMLNANMGLQQAFINMLADITQEVAAFAEFQNLASQNLIIENSDAYNEFMRPVFDDQRAYKQKNGGDDWTPSGTDNLNMTEYQAKTQQNNATGQAINQSVSTDSSAGTNLMQGVQGDSSNFTTMVGYSIDTALSSMRLQ
jgi:hypothetical protein